MSFPTRPALNRRRPLAASLAKFRSAAAIGAALMASSAHAQIAWDAESGTDLLWSNPLNWVGDLEPTAADAVVFPTPIPNPGALATPGTITLDALGETALSVSFQDAYRLTGGGLTLGGSGSINVNAAVTATIDSALSAGAGLTKIGGGTLILGGLNTFTGTLTVAQGFVNFGADGNLGTTNNAILLDGGGLRSTIAGNGWEPAVGRVVTIGAGGGTLGGTGAIRFGGGITAFNTRPNQLAGSGTLTKIDSNALDLSAANTGFTGNVVLNQGVIELRHSQGLGTNSGGTQTITVNGGELAAGNGAIVPQVVAVNGGTLSFANTNNSSFAGAIQANANFNLSLKDWYGTTARNGAVSGPISGSGNVNVTAPGAAQVLVSGNNASFSGDVTVGANATVRAVQGASNNALGTGDVILNGGTLGIAPAVTSAGPNSGFYGQYYNAGAALIGNGVIGGYDFGLVTPVGARNDATINTPNNTGGYFPGVPGFNATNIAGLWTGVINVAAGGSYTFFTSSDDGSLLYVDGQQVVQNDFSQGFTERSGAITLTAGLHTIIAKFGQGTGGAGMVASYQGPDTTNAKVVIGSGGGAVTNTGSSLFASTTVGNNITVDASSSIDLAGTSVTSTGTLALNSGNLTVTGVTGSETFTQSGPVTLAGAHTITTGRNQVLNGLANASAGADLIISGDIGQNAPGASLTKAGPRTLTLTGNNSFSGGLTISGGTVVASVSGLGTGNITNNSAFVLDQATNATISQNITGTGTVTKVGNGVIALNGANNLGGNLTINGGGITLGTNLAGGGAITVNAGASLGGAGTTTAKAVTVNSGGAILGATGNPFSVGNLTLNAAQANLTLSAPTTTSALVSTGAFAPNFAIVNLANGGSAGAGTYRLLDYSGTALTAAQFSNFVLGTNPAGFYGALVNNTANTSVDLVLQAAAATNTWTGAASGTWDTSAANWSSGSYVEGTQVVFPGTGVANRSISGPAVNPQSVSVDTSGGDYSIANDIGGGVVGGLNKSGAGTLTLTGNNTIAGKTTVTAGVLSVAVDNASGTRSAGTGQVELAGGTYSIAPTADAVSGLLGSYFNGAAGATSVRDYTGTPVLTRIESVLNNTYTAVANPGPGVGTVNAANLENFGAQFTGKFFVSSGGPQTFAVAADDAVRLFIDGVPVIIDEGGQGGTYMFTNTVNLSEGYHDIRIQYNQGTGGGNIKLYTPNGVGIEGLSLTDTVNLGSLLNVTSSSTLDLAGSNFATASFGALTQNAGTTLNITGLAGKQLSFGSTVVNGAGTTTINTAPDVTLGAVTAPGVTLVKQGAGRLVLDNTSVATPNNLTGSTIEVQGGELVAVGGGGTNNPLGTASVVLNGGGLFLDAKSAATTFANNVTLQQAATIETLPSTLTMTLGSAANTLSLGAHTLTVDTYAGGTDSVVAGSRQSIGNAAGSTLLISSPISGSGNIVKTSTQLNSTNAISLSRQPGQLTLAAESPNYSGTTIINRGSLQANGASAATSRVLGTGGVVINVTNLYSGDTTNTPGILSGNTGLVNTITRNPSLLLKSNSTGNATTVNFGNALTLQGPGTQVTIDVNNNGANSNNTIQLGALNVSGGLNQLNVTGGNSYYLGFDPASTTTLPNQATSYLGTTGFIVNPTTGNLRFGGTVNEAGTLMKIGAGTLRLDGANSIGSLTVRGGTLAFTNQAAVPSSFSTMNGSALQLAGAGGSFADAATPTSNSLSLSAGSIVAAVRFDNSLGLTTNPGGRWGDTAPLVLNATANTHSDSLVLVPNGGTAVTETIGSLSFRGGARARVTPNYANGIATLQVDSLARLDRGTLDIATSGATSLLGAAGTQTGTLGSAAANGSRIIVTGVAPARGNNGTGTVNMVTPTIWNSTTQTFVDYAGPNGFADVTYGSTNLNAPGSITTVNAAATALTTSPTVYALKLTGALTSAAAQTVTIQGDQTVGNDGTAGLIAIGAFTANDANTTLFFGTSGASPQPREAVIHTGLATGNNVTFAGKIVANGLTKDGDAVILMTADQTRAGSGATLTGLEGDIVVNRGGLSLRAQNAVGKGGSGAPGSGTTRIVLAGGTLETRLDTATTFGAGGAGGVGYDIVIRENSTINPDRVSTNNIAHAFGNLSFEPTADALRVIANSQHRITFGGTTAINLPNLTTFDVTDNGANAVMGGLFNSTATLTTRGQLTGNGIIKIGAGKWQASAGGGSMTFTGGTRVENGSLMFEYNPTVAGAGAPIQFGSGAITISNGGNFGVFGNSGVAISGNVDFTNNINVVDFGGGFHLAHATANQQLRFTGQINLAAPLTIGSGNAGNLGNDPQYGLTGSTVINIDQNAVGARMLVLSGNDEAQVNGNIVDTAGSANNPLVIQNQLTGALFINGTGNTYAGGTRIIPSPNNGNTVGRVDVGATSQLGTGDVLVEGGFLAISALSNVASGKKITLTPSYGAAGVLAFKNMSPSQADIVSVVGSGSSNSIIALSNGTAQTNVLDLGAIGDGTNFLGAAITNTTYNASSLGVGAGNTYRIGGGNATLTIGNPTGNVFTGGNKLQVGNALVHGGFAPAAAVTLNGSNDFTGGTTVALGTSTLTVAGTNGLGTGPLTVWSGSAQLNATQSVSAVTIKGGAVISNVTGALGSGPITIGVGRGTTSGPSLTFTGVEQTISNAVNITGDAFIRPNLTTRFNSGLNFTEANAALVASGQQALILTQPATGPEVATSSTTVLASPNGRAVNTALAISNWNQLGGGNVNLSGGVLILDGTGLGGRQIGGTGANQIQITTAMIAGAGTNGTQTGTTIFNQNNAVGGGFAARGTPLTITNADVVNASAFDRDFTLGSAATFGGAFYANASVTLDADTTITARRYVTIGRTGPGLTKQSNASGVVINNISADFSGAGSLVFRSNMSTNGAGVAGDPMSEVVLSGALTYTGSPSEDTDGGGASRWISAGPGGLIVSTGSSNPAENGDIFVRFNGQISLPNGNAGAPAYIMANRYAGTGVLPFRTGVLFTGDADGENYRLNTGYRLALNGNNGTGAPVAATFGSTGGAALLRDSQIALIGGLNTSTAAASSALLVRDGTFTLGDGTGAVRFQPANYNIATADNTDPGATAAATGLSDNTGARTIQVRGSGSAIVGNVAYRNAADGGDTSGQFTWQLGSNTAGVAEGFLRETTDTGATGNLSNVRLTMAGGVLELPGTHRAINLGTGVGQINMAGGVGGGFAAVGGPSTVNIGGANATMTWASTAQFLGAGHALILGSPAADNKLTLTNPISLNGAARSIAVIRGTGSVSEAELSGALSGTAASVLNIASINRPDGTAYDAGTLVLSGNSAGYLGATNVNAGTLLVDGVLGGTTVTAGVSGVLGGDGSIAAAVSVNGVLAPGSNGTGVLDITNTLSFGASSTFAAEIGGTGLGLYDQVTTTSVASLTAGAELTLSLASGFDPNTAPGSVFYLVIQGGATPFPNAFANAPEGALVDFGDGVLGNVTYLADFTGDQLTGGNDLAVYNLVPEPSSALMLLGGLGALAGMRRRRQS